MGALQNTVFFAIFIGVLVTVHELGHFLAAKWAGVKVLKFSIGFGPKLFGFRRGETEYQIAAVPLGGFVRMAGEIPGDDVPEEDVKRSFLSAPWWKRAIIVVAGPAFNLIFPILAYWVAFLGDHQVISARVGWVEPEYPAARAGILPGDLITKVDGTPIRAFDEIRAALDGVWEREVAATRTSCCA
jgi:regulator of sigma E protease